ncbi:MULTISPECIES: DUF6221 family protein [unclassified Streptomyces]|uniref:DUF6221 family protein n=1 Tax=unclassified Streptomyces TaxID=2593676 RepID=UPI0024A83C51|nr:MULTISPECIES: DUF6221 family protein [unclassified Streptomyces]
MDLMQFLRDRLDEDEQAARRAGDSFRQIGETGVIVATEGDRAEECASANWAGIAEHIVRHDPARVLRDVEAKQRVLALHSTPHTVVDGFCVEDGGPCTHRGEAECTLCGETGCTTLRLLVLPYANHPNYRDDWRP